MKLSAVAATEDLAEAVRRNFRKASTQAGERFLRFAGLPRDACSLVEYACNTVSDRPEVRSWQHSVNLVDDYLSGDSGAPLSTILGHFELDAPRLDRVFQLLCWEVCALAFDDAQGEALTLQGLPPRVLPVGERGAFARISQIPVNSSTLVRNRDGVVLHVGDVLREGASDGTWIQPIVVPSTSLKATVPLHLPRLLARDQQDLPIVQSEVYAQAWARDVANAGNVLGRYLDDSTRPVLKLVSRILPIFCPPPNVGSGSREEALGHVFLPATDEQDQIAECLYHEALHQYLFHLEHCVDLFDASTPSESRFYSPWRSDPRPLRMTLHGAFVFAGVAEFYLWREAEVELGINARECHRRAFHRTKQARRALEIVERHGRPTRAGRLVIGSIEATLDAISLLVRPHTEDKREVETLIAEHEARFAAYER